MASFWLNLAAACAVLAAIAIVPARNHLAMVALAGALVCLVINGVRLLYG